MDRSREIPRLCITDCISYSSEVRSGIRGVLWKFLFSGLWFSVQQILFVSMRSFLGSSNYSYERDLNTLCSMHSSITRAGARGFDEKLIDIRVP